MPQVPYSPAPSVQNTGAGGNQFGLNVTADMFGGGTGRALQGLAGNLDRFGDVMAREAIRIGQFNQEVDLTELKNWSDKTIMDGVNNVTGDGLAFKGNFEKGFDEQAKSLRQKYPQARNLETQILDLRRQYTNKVNGVQIQKANEHYKIQLDDKANQAYKDIQDNPTDANLKNWQSQMTRLIDASGLGAAQKEAYKKFVQDTTTQYYAYGAAQKDPDRVLGALGGTNSLIGAIGQKESGNQPIGAHPGSSAWGRYGFTEGTWTQVANSPEGKRLGLDPNPEARKIDANQQIGVKILTKLNAEVLQQNGIQPTDANLYMAHFMGAGGAAKFLMEMQRNPGRSAAEVFPKAAGANPKVFYTRATGPDGDTQYVARSLQEVYNIQTKGLTGKVSALPGSDPALDSLPPDARAKVLNVASNFLSQQTAAAEAQRTAEYNNMLNDIGLSVRQGMYGTPNLNQMIANGTITDMKDIAKVEGWIKKYSEERSAVQLVQERMGRGEGLNPFNETDKAGVKGISETWQSLPREQRLANNYNLAAQTGVIPPDLAGEIKQGMNSSNGQAVLNAAAAAAALMAEPGRSNIFNGVEGGDNIRSLIADYNALRMAGYSGAGLGERLAERNRAEGERQFKFVPKDLDEAITKFKEDPTARGRDKLTAAGVLPSWYQFGSGSADAAVAAKAAEDYMSEFSYMYKLSGDKTRSDLYAQQRLAQVYGVFNGEAMKFPPNKVLPKDIEGSDKYIQEDVVKSLERKLGRPVTGFKLVTRDDTYDAAQTGRPVPYNVIAEWTLPNGMPMWDLIAGDTWIADRGLTEKRNNEIREKRERERLGYIQPEEVPATTYGGSYTPEERKRVADELNAKADAKRAEQTSKAEANRAFRNDLSERARRRFGPDSGY